MSAFLDQLHNKSLALVKREVITLPESGMRVVVRSLMSGDMLRVNAMSDDLQALAMFAFATEDPDNPGRPIANWNTQEDRDKLAAVHVRDLTAVGEAHTRVSGGATKGAEKNSPEGGSSSTSSPSATESSRRTRGAAERRGLLHARRAGQEAPGSILGRWWT
jgi:hypothetical protein